MEHEKIAQYVLKELKKKADDVIVNLVSLKNQQIKFSNNKISATKNFNSMDMGVFLAKNNMLDSDK